MQKLLRYAACLALFCSSPTLADVDFDVRDPKVDLHNHSLLAPAPVLEWSD